ncbi:hypothetical protein [Piscinibacter sakaiensis]|uniref:hypothetical protein n=1 Tax=Piscinibacter sakaiensis TaxID=1547922 RepID=UPI00372CF56B
MQRALEAGWRPAVAMEVFDRERQADIERARRERPGDADHLIAQAGGRGWDWPLLRPLIALVLAQGPPSRSRPSTSPPSSSRRRPPSSRAARRASACGCSTSRTGTPTGATPAIRGCRRR